MPIEGSDVNITCDCAASDLGLLAHLAPALRCGVAEASRMSCTTSWYPAFLKVACHAGAHDPQSDKSHLHVGSPGARSCCSQYCNEGVRHGYRSRSGGNLVTR